MYVIVGNPRYRLIALGVSLGIFLLLYFTVIKPGSDTANQAVRVGEQQVQQAVKAANTQSHGAVPSNVTKLTACIAAAGTDAGQIQLCDSKYKP